ncbi:MAG: hypothetical protein IKJ89_02360 [Kiritimatiellae bacterium]|nr:hypothetical protein [Kiritimatiellia bacterium]
MAVLEAAVVEAQVLALAVQVDMAEMEGMAVRQEWYQIMLIITNFVEMEMQGAKDYLENLVRQWELAM